MNLGKGKRTLAINSLAFLAAVLATPELLAFFDNPATAVKVFGGAITAINIVMRFLTTTPIGKKS